jgi:hypothetical protein
MTALAGLGRERAKDLAKGTAIGRVMAMGTAVEQRA